MVFMKVVNKFSFRLILTVFALAGVGCGSAMLSDERLATRSKSQFSKMKKSERVSNNLNHKAMVERIGKRIAQVARVDLPGTE